MKNPLDSITRTPSSERGWLAVAAGLSVAGLIVGVDVARGSDTVITTALILAPFVTALLSKRCFMYVVLARPIWGRERPDNPSYARL